MQGSTSDTQGGRICRNARRLRSGWTAVPFVKIATVIAGISRTGRRSRTIERRSKGGPFLQGNADFSGVSRTPVPKCLVQFSSQDIEKRRHSTSVFVAPVGEVNRSGQIEYAYWTRAGRMFEPRRCDPDFLYYALQRWRHLNLQRVGQGTTFVAVTARHFAIRCCVAFSLKNQAEQAAIARILDAVDTMLERTREAAARARHYKRALVQRVFAKGLYGEDQRETPIGYIPKSWQVVSVKSVVDDFQYGLSVGMDGRGSLPILRMGNIQDGEISFHDVKYVALPEEITKPYLLSRGDVLFNRTNSQEWIGKIGIYRHDKQAVFASYLIRLRPRPARVDAYYLGHVLGTYSAQCRIKRFATPGVQQVNVNATNLGKVLIPLPMGQRGLVEQPADGCTTGGCGKTDQQLRTQTLSAGDPQAFAHARSPHRQGPGWRHSGGVRVMSEYGYVEQPILNWLCGETSGTDHAGGLGWIYRDDEAMAAFERPLEDPIVERLLNEAIVRINPNVRTAMQAWPAVEALRKAMGHPDRLTANRSTLDLLRDGARVVLDPGEDAQTVQYIAFDPDRQHLNDFTVTTQYRVQGVRQCRDDTVLLVNGIPLVVAEYKSYVSSGKDWREAVHQLHRYQRQAPLMLAPNVFCVAADEEEFRYGTVLFHDASKEEIDRHLDLWGRWLSLYPDYHGWWNEPDASNPDDPLEVPVKGLLRLKPAHVLDFLQHFVVFETKKGRTTKKVARYQQFEAVNELVDRTVSHVRKPVSAQDRTGLIWHTQGSGKSLTMVFAGQKLRRHPALDNPTVLIVVDRRDLKTQLSDDFDACDYPNVEKALGVQDLKQKLRSDWRGTLVTTIQSFQQMGRPRPTDPRQHRQYGGRVPPLTDRHDQGQPREPRADHAGEASERISVRLHRDPHRPDPAEHPPRFRPADGRRSGALPELLRHPPLDPGRGHAGSALPP